MEDNVNDERILYLRNALMSKEDELHEWGIKVGILGENRDNYDLMLIPLEEEKGSEVQVSDKGTFELRKSIRDASDFVSFSNIHHFFHTDLYCKVLIIYLRFLNYRKKLQVKNFHRFKLISK